MLIELRQAKMGLTVCFKFEHLNAYTQPFIVVYVYFVKIMCLEAAKFLALLRIYTVSPEPSLFTKTMSPLFTGLVLKNKVFKDLVTLIASYQQKELIHCTLLTENKKIPANILASDVLCSLVILKK